MHRDLDYVRASASLPLVSHIVGIHGSLYLDGGICDSIPLTASIRHGYKKNIVILTRPYGYRKSPSHMLPAVAYMYRNYPKFIQAYKARYLHYNHALELVAKQEAEGKLFKFLGKILIIRTSGVYQEKQDRHYFSLSSSLATR